jgi:hypothetical protein
LRSLNYEGSRENLPMGALSIFITRSRCALTQLSLSAVVVRDIELIEFLKLLPSVETLQLRSPRGDSIGMSDRLLQYFSLNPPPEFALEVANFLPILQTLRYSGKFTISWASLAEMFPIAALLDGKVVSLAIQQPNPVDALNIRRRPLRSVDFKFYENRKAERIPLEVLPRLVGALNDGVSVKIFQWESRRETDMLRRGIMEFEATSNIRLVPSNDEDVARN